MKKYAEVKSVLGVKLYHSFADCGIQVLLFIGMKRSEKEATRKHPMGFGFWQRTLDNYDRYRRRRAGAGDQCGAFRAY
jgi:hypothetical protein